MHTLRQAGVLLLALGPEVVDRRTDGDETKAKEEDADEQASRVGQLCWGWGGGWDGAGRKRAAMG